MIKLKEGVGRGPEKRNSKNKDWCVEVSKTKPISNHINYTMQKNEEKEENVVKIILELYNFITL